MRRSRAVPDRRPQHHADRVPVRRRERLRRRAALAVAAVVPLTLLAAVPSAPAAPTEPRPDLFRPGPAASAPDAPGRRVPSDLRAAGTTSRVIGRSVEGRPIVAWRLGDRGARPRTVVLAAMHGNELAPREILWEIRRRAPRIDAADIWVVPTYNPDGAVDYDRQNARGVDLNRNFPVRWKPLTGNYYSGPQPASEPETRAIMRFLTDVDPRWVVSFHQPLDGIDNSSAKDPALGRRLSRGLGVPIREFDCGGVCHGTLTQWFNARRRGAAITVELGSSPTLAYLRGRGASGTLEAIGAFF